MFWRLTESIDLLFLAVRSDMTNSAKRRALNYLLLTVLITMLLAAALPQLELQNGLPLPARENSGTQTLVEEEKLSLSIKFSTFLKTVFSLLLILMLIYFVIKVRKKPVWKEMAQVLLRMAVMSLVVTAVFFSLANVQVTLDPTEFEVLPTEVKRVGPALEPLPPSLLWLVWAGLFGGVVLMVVILFRWRREPTWAASDPLTLEAEQAVQSIKAGQDLRGVIIHCYRQMSLILQKEQNVARAETMTAREFEALLGARGIPDAPVRRLTRLFETARYGAHPPGADEEQQAIECLSAIIQFSQKKGAGLLK